MEKILLSQEGNNSVGPEEQIDHFRVSRLIEDFLYLPAVDRGCGDDETAKSWSTNDDSGYASGSAPPSAKRIFNSGDTSVSPASFVPDFPTNTERGDRSHPNHRTDNVPPSPSNDISHVGPLKAGSNSAEVPNFQLFRVGVEDRCSKVLSDALKKYNVQADLGLWSLWLIDGDQERCLGLNERPLTVFRELTKEGRKPGFILGRYALTVENQPATEEPFPLPSPTQPLSKGSLPHPNML